MRAGTIERYAEAIMFSLRLRSAAIFLFLIILHVSVPGAARAERNVISPEAIDTLSRVSEAMVQVVSAVRPSVVNISTTKTVEVGGRGVGSMNDPLLRRFFGDEFMRQFSEPREKHVTSLGSGVIVQSDGLIITNNHVIKDADEINVTLNDKREFTGRVIGTDPKTDIAVLRIEAKGLTPVRWGDSDKLNVGETVIAIGIPYGLSQTVTSGIVSAKGRANVRIADYEDFIQTDAAINPGNSGGPLINVRGELVGINTAIFSTSGGYQGIGFAIPSNMASSVLKSLLSEGKVVRGWMGVTVQPVTKELARQFGLDSTRGVLISDVNADGPAEKGGIRRGDIVLSFGKREVVDPTGLRNLVAATRPGQKVNVVVIRNGERKTLRLLIGELPGEKQEIEGLYNNVFNGVHVQDLTPELRRTLGMPERLKGVLVSNVETNIGLKRGDVIMEINRVKTATVKEYHVAASAIGPDDDALALVYREGSVIYLNLSKKR